jgi:hypothetical protein
VIVVNLGVGRVFDLDARYVARDFVVADDDGRRLTDVDSRVARARDETVLDENVRRGHRVDPVTPVAGARAAGPLHVDVADRDAVDLGRAQPVSLRIVDAKGIDDVVIGGNFEPVGAGRLGAEIEHRVVRSAQRHVRRCERELPGDRKSTGT